MSTTNNKKESPAQAAVTKDRANSAEVKSNIINGANASNSANIIDNNTNASNANSNFTNSAENKASASNKNNASFNHPANSTTSNSANSANSNSANSTENKASANNKNIAAGGSLKRGHGAPKPPKGTAKRLFLAIFKTNPLVCVLVFLFIIISAFANVMGSVFIQRLIDDYIAPLLLQNNPVFDKLLRAIAFMGCIYAVGVTTNFLFNRMMVGLSQKALKRIRDEMFSHMQLLPIRFYDAHSRGDIMSLYTNDTDTLREFISQSLPQLLSGLVTILVVGVSMFMLNVYLSLLVLACVAAMLVVSRALSKRAAVYFRRTQQKLGGLNGYIEEMMSGQKVIKVFCHEQAAIAEFDKKNSALCSDATKANRMTNIMMPVLMEMGNFQYLFIALVGGFMAIKGYGGVTLGTIAAFLVLSRSFSAPIGQISSQINVVISALAGSARIFTFLDCPPEEDKGDVTLVFGEYKDGQLCETEENTGIWAWKQRGDSSGENIIATSVSIAENNTIKAKAIAADTNNKNTVASDERASSIVATSNGNAPFTYTRVRGEVVFDNVDFGYNEDEIILHGINIHAKPGQKIAFVGATGAGKTTITNLLNRFYDIAGGNIIMDDIDISRMKKDDLRRALGIVLQDTHLFSGTVEDNIRYGNMLATKEDIIKAATLANAHDFIMRLPEGYDTFIRGDGASLSGGQRQLIAIARAAVSDPPVMILDEATSSIDTRTELLVQKGMDGLMRGRTVFVIAHRLSTVKNSDLIIVLERGNIIESGNHTALIAQKGKYYQLYTGGLADS